MGKSPHNDINLRRNHEDSPTKNKDKNIRKNELEEIKVSNMSEKKLYESDYRHNVSRENNHPNFEEQKEDDELFLYDNRAVIQQICPEEWRNPFSSDIYKGFNKKLKVGRPFDDQRRPYNKNLYDEEQKLNYHRNNPNRDNTFQKATFKSKPKPKLKNFSQERSKFPSSTPIQPPKTPTPHKDLSKSTSFSQPLPAPLIPPAPIPAHPSSTSSQPSAPSRKIPSSHHGLYTSLPNFVMSRPQDLVNELTSRREPEFDLNTDADFYEAVLDQHAELFHVYRADQLSPQEFVQRVQQEKQFAMAVWDGEAVLVVTTLQEAGEEVQLQEVMSKELILAA
mmetsp:Transcript_41215/g.47471  ORF Transcript_41215/g.47471 Transcript_41215/m.47471 type:complete len:336 (-) Transcript_41215:84-1091(-)